MEHPISMWVREAIDRVRAIDMHTHLFPPSCWAWSVSFQQAVRSV
ncbi:hypothetical protein [Alicyclobacillus acidocaldarius]|uniref:Uncharacterized protein n=1 Tax=Alicyclobacillus acidocaldarius subsp. acidocaldarius (strain ATCC 27009 / DSM 446 / BCRC 14685 / JCM 5260 / KCTC 1825 / NBRC 15652 / NCIMB 11725 / NRRL B-14509 / 104-IA) TaxID=521098 RepID=C8WQC6_ALIAD|nr:hypothetical protein [Alicyclobacillus acidocaldarius]ACV59071.1 hypothetical protein Aaci_2061 [Alicyclobacillus acidocaldarius subsp. acidocaldarius DSM 446]